MKMVMITTSMILVEMMSRRQQRRKLDQDSRILTKKENIFEQIVLYCPYFSYLSLSEKFFLET